MQVCVCVRMSVCMCVCLFVYVHVSLCLWVCVCVCAHACACVHACVNNTVKVSWIGYRIWILNVTKKTNSLNLAPILWDEIWTSGSGIFRILQFNRPSHYEQEPKNRMFEFTKYFVPYLVSAHHKNADQWTDQRIVQRMSQWMDQLL